MQKIVKKSRFTKSVEGRNHRTNISHVFVSNGKKQASIENKASCLCLLSNT